MPGASFLAAAVAGDIRHVGVVLAYRADMKIISAFLVGELGHRDFIVGLEDILPCLKFLLFDFIIVFIELIYIKILIKQHCSWSQYLFEMRFRELEFFDLSDILDYDPFMSKGGFLREVFFRCINKALFAEGQPIGGSEVHGFPNIESMRKSAVISFGERQNKFSRLLISSIDRDLYKTANRLENEGGHSVILPFFFAVPVDSS